MYDFEYEHQAEQAFTDWLDDTYGEIWVCGYEYSAGRLLKEIDPIAFRWEFLKWCDAGEIDIDTLK